MPFLCFKKEKKSKKSSSKASSANGSTEAQNAEKNENSEKASGTPPLDTAKAMEMELRSPRKDRTPKSVRVDEGAKEGATKKNRSSSESSSPSYETPRPSSARKTEVVIVKENIAAGGSEEQNSEIKSEKAKTPRSGRARTLSSPKSPRLNATSTSISFAPEESVTTPPRSPKVEPREIMSARVAPTQPAAATPVFFSPRPINRRGSTFSTRSRGSFTSFHTNSITQRDWTKIQFDTDTAMASERTRILERKQTLAANVEASLATLRKLEEDAKRQSQELDLNALDDMELDDAEVELAKFKEEDFNEEALEEKIFEQHIVAHLEQDVQETKRALAALNDNDSSMDLDDLDNLSDALDLDDSQDLDGLEIINGGQDGGSDDEYNDDDFAPSSSQFASSPSNDNINRSLPPFTSSPNFDDPSLTEETHTERQGSDTDLSISAGLSPRRQRLHSNGEAKIVDTLA